MYYFSTYTILLQLDSLLEETNMAVLGKDLFDLGRPDTHTKIQFGDRGYWVELNAGVMGRRVGGVLDAN